jgi:hypothetical protein
VEDCMFTCKCVLVFFFYGSTESQSSILLNVINLWHMLQLKWYGYKLCWQISSSMILMQLVG